MPPTESLDRRRVRLAVERYQRGDDPEGAFRELVEILYRPLHRFFERRGAGADDAHDLTQETFVRIYGGMDQFRRESGFETWLFAVAGNVFLRRERDRRTQKRGAGVEPSSLETALEVPSTDQPDALDGLIRGQRLEQLRTAMEALPTQMRTVLGLSIYQERSRREIAEALGLSPETVKAHLYQARRRLAEALRQPSPENEPENEP